MAKTKTVRKTSNKRPARTKSMKKAGASRKKKSSTQRGEAQSSPAAGDAELTIDRRRGERRRDPAETAEAATTGAPKLERRQKVNRRRQIDPTTCERDYTEQEVEFMNALDEYKRRSGRMFPTCSEVLEVIRSLGYVRLTAAERNRMPGATTSAASAKPMPGDWSAASPSLESLSDDAASAW